MKEEEEQMDRDGPMGLIDTFSKESGLHHENIRFLMLWFAIDHFSPLEPFWIESLEISFVIPLHLEMGIPFVKYQGFVMEMVRYLMLIMLCIVQKVD